MVYRWGIEYFSRGWNSPQSRFDQTDWSIISKYDLMLEQTTRQASTKNAAYFRNSRETPLNVGVGLTLHSSTRNKQLVELLHKLGIPIDYSRVLRLETQIATSVLKNIKNNSGVYIPSDIILGRFIHCAADNIDFMEDTPDRERTFHGTIMTIYQTKNADEPVKKLTLHLSNDISLTNYSDIFPTVNVFRKPVTWNTCCPVPRTSTEKSFMRPAIETSRLCNIVLPLCVYSS